MSILNCENCRVAHRKERNCLINLLLVIVSLGGLASQVMPAGFWVVLLAGALIAAVANRLSAEAAKRIEAQFEREEAEAELYRVQCPLEVSERRLAA